MKDLAVATRRFADRKAQWFLTHGADTCDKAGLDKSRRMLDKALIAEAVADMAEGDPEPEYYAVEDVFYDDDHWYPEYFIKAAFDCYNAAYEFACERGGWVVPTDKDEFEYWENDRKQWEFCLKRSQQTA
jgi:hypothetical protein